MVKIEIFEGSDKQWYWHLRAANGEIVHHSEGYTTKQAALKSADRVRELAARAEVVMKG